MSSLAQGAHGQTSSNIFGFFVFLFFPCVVLLLVLGQSNLKPFVVFCGFYMCCFSMCFSYVPFICGIGRASPDPWARSEWWATQRQVQRDCQLAAGRCASFRLPSAPPTAYGCCAALHCAALRRSAPLRSAVLHCAALHCAALRFHLVYWLGLP